MRVGAESPLCVARAVCGHSNLSPLRAAWPCRAEHEHQPTACMSHLARRMLRVVCCGECCTSRCALRVALYAACCVARCMLRRACLRERLEVPRRVDHESAVGEPGHIVHRAPGRGIPEYSIDRYIYIYIISIYLSIYLSTYLSIYLYTNAHTHTPTHTHTHTHTHPHTQTNTHTHKHTRTHTHTHTHTHTRSYTHIHSYACIHTATSCGMKRRRKAAELVCAQPCACTRTAAHRS